jgi:hypothetical protein
MHKTLISKLFAGSLIALAGGLVLLAVAGGLAIANSSLVKNGPDVTGIHATALGWVMIGPPLGWRAQNQQICTRPTCAASTKIGRAWSVWSTSSFWRSRSPVTFGNRHGSGPIAECTQRCPGNGSPAQAPAP